MADDVGGIFVTVTPDTAGFKEKLQSDLEAETRGSDVHVAGHLDLDDAEFKTGLDSADRQGKSFGAQKFTPRLDLDDGELASKFDANVARLNALTDRAWEIKVKPSDTEAVAELDDLRQKLVDLTTEAYDGQIGLEGVDAVKVQIDDLEAKLDEFGARSVSAKVSVSGADKASSDLDKAGKSADNASGGMSKLVSAAIAVGPALIPIGAVAVAGISGIAALAGSAAVGIGAFALAAKGDFAGIATSAKAMLATFQEENQATVLPALANVLPILQAGFDDLEPLVQGAATAIGQFGVKAESALTSPFWQSFFNLLGNQAQHALTTFGNLALGVATAMAGLDRAFAPVITDIEGGLDRMAASMERFGATAGTNSGLAHFVAYIEQEGPQVLHVLETLGSDFGTLAADAGALGPSFLSVIGGAAELLGDLERLNPQLTELAIVVLSAYKAFQLLSPVIGVFKDIGNLSSLFAGTAEADTAASGLGKAAVAAGNFRTSIYEAGAASLNASAQIAAVGEAAQVTGAELEATAAEAGAAGTELEAAGGEARLAGVGFSAALGVVGLLAAGMVELTHVLGASGAAAGAAGKAIGTDLVQKVSSSGQTLAQQITTIKMANDGLAQQMNVLAKNGGFTSDAFSKLANEYKTNEAAIKSLTDQEQANAQYTSLIGTTAAGSAGQVQNLTDKAYLLNSALATAAATQRTNVAAAFQGLNADITTQTSDLSNLSAALGVLVGNYLSAKSATLNQEIALDSFSSSLKAANGNLSGNNAASRQAQESAVSWSQSLYSTLIPALLQGGDSASQVSTVTQGLIAKFDAAALGSHATAAQVAALNVQYGLTPHDIKTTIELIGASGVVSAVESARRELQSIATTYTATIQETTIEQTIIHSRIPGNAAGTSFHPGGLSWVGEKGPEIVDLPAGTKVLPNGKSMDMVRAGVMTPPGYADGVGLGAGLGGVALGHLLGTQFNAGLDQALASDPHTVTIAGGSGRGVGGSGAGGGAGNPLHPGFGDLPAFRGSGGGRGSNPLSTITPAIVASLTSMLQQMRTVALDQGQQVIDALTKTTKTLKNGTTQVVSLPGNTVLNPAQIDAIASQLPKAIAAKIEAAGPLTVSQLKSLFAKLNADVPLSDIDAIAKKLPTEIVDELKKAGPLTVAQFKSLADSLTKTLNSASGDITKGLHGTFAQLSTEVGDAKKAIDKAFGGTELATIIDSLAKNFDFLSTKAKESLSTITSQLSAAQTGLASIKSQISQSASNLESPFNITSVTGTSFPTGGGSSWTAPVTGSNIIASLQADVKSLKTYRTLLDTLKGWGLSTELLAELVAAGPGQGMAAAQALVAGGKKEVNLADVLQGQIDATSTQIATISATAVIGGKTVGLSQAEGIVTGLENSKAKVTAELDKLAKDMQQAINAALKIDGGKSGTFKTLGEQMIQGLQDGIKGASGALKTELEQVVKSLEQTLGIHPAAGGSGGGGSAGKWSGAGSAWGAGWNPSAKLKQKALAFDAGTLPGGSGSGGGALALTYAPTFTVNGDVGPEKFEAKMMTLLKNDRDVFVSEMQRWIARF